MYVAELRKIAECCEYGGVLNDMLRDRLVCGTSNKGIQRRLLQQAELTFDKAMEMAQAAEAAEKDSECLTGATADKNHPTSEVLVPPAALDSVHNVTQQRKQRNNAKQQGGGSPQPTQSGCCYRCGGQHKQSACPREEWVCHFCKKKGHLAKVCRKKHKQKTEQTNAVTVEQTPASGLTQCTTYNREQVNPPRPQSW